MKNKNKKRISAQHYAFIGFVFINIILLGTVVYLINNYIDKYDDKLYEENIDKIENLNKASSIVTSTLINDFDSKLNDCVKVIEEMKLNYNEALEYLYICNSNKKIYYEIIGPDYLGHMARKEKGEFIEASFSSDSTPGQIAQSFQSLEKAFLDVDDDDFIGACLMPEFTDNTLTGEKMFGIYHHVNISNDDLQTKYTILLFVKSSDIIDELNKFNDYDNQSIALINLKGDYIVSNSKFKSTNFYQYLKDYNKLSLDETNKIKEEVEKNNKGQLFYQNAYENGECLYYYEMADTNEWYCITCVPKASFHKISQYENGFILIICLLVSLLVIDLVYLQFVNHRLKLSARKEAMANASKSNFMSRMSHEIRTPLNAVIGYNTIAKSVLTSNDPDSDETSKRKLEDCLDKSLISSKHLLMVINDVLDISAIESDKIKINYEMFDFKGLINSLTTIFYSQLKRKNINFEVVFNNFYEEWFIGDELRINQILTNMLSNAMKFTPEDGYVKIQINQEEKNTNESLITFIVSDTGIGMSKEYLTHIWAPFEQEDSSIRRRFGGSGLGLSISKKLVDLMNGDISVESEEGKGTTFTIKIPFKRTEQPQKVITYDFSTVNALVVDDDISSCEYISDLFLRCGAKCSIATSGEKAISMFQESLEKNNPYTLCLVDWQMPKMNGIEVIRKLRELFNEDVPIIIISAYDLTEVKDKVGDIKINKFISKPLFHSTLFDLLISIFGKVCTNTNSVHDNIEVDFHKARVLLVEDNVMNMEIAKHILTKANMSVDCAWNGEEAISMYESNPAGTYSIVLMDVHMPVMDGYTATGNIRKSSHSDAKTIPIIAMTADAFSTNVKEALDSGMDDHISKPIDVNLLYIKLKKHLKQ